MHILIVRPGAIGDTLLTFPVIQALKTHYPNAHITLVGNAVVLPLALSFGIADEISDYGHPQWSELFSTAGIRTFAMQNVLQQTDLAICWLHDADNIVKHNLLKAGAKRVIIAPGRPPTDQRMHVVEYLAKTVGLQHLGAAHSAQFIAPMGLGRFISAPDHFPIAIHPGSGGAQKCWPVSSFAAVIAHLLQCNYPVLLLAGPADFERLKQVRDHLSSDHSDMLTILENAPLLEVAHQLVQCSGYLGNDSGITHLAAMLGVPTVALFGPSDPVVWRPIGPCVEVIQAPILAQLSVERVLESIFLRLFKYK